MQSIDDYIKVSDFRKGEIEAKIRDLETKKEKFEARLKEYQRNNRDYEVVQSLREYLELLDIRIEEEKNTAAHIEYQLTIQKENT